MVRCDAALVIVRSVVVDVKIGENKEVSSAILRVGCIAFFYWQSWDGLYRKFLFICLALSGSIEITFKKLLLCEFLSRSAVSVAVVSWHQSPLRTAGSRAQCSEDGLLAKDQFDALQFQLFSWRLNLHMLSKSHLSCWCNCRFTLFGCRRIAERSTLAQCVQGNVASMLEVCPSNSKV